jgi:hypothetical protein
MEAILKGERTSPKVKKKRRTKILIITKTKRKQI